ncbi:putative quinol monooxygenase [Paraburkholderia sediminicola]|uniref:putative quinol monooxygenase n=1 Tax=Paraburkholderia sediminicola TaxID=458836 RepID=UPI0038B936AD
MSSVIQVVAVVQGKPGTAEAIERAVSSCVVLSRAEPGCRLYAPHRDVERADRFVFIESWLSREALAEHERTAHFQTMVQELALLLAEPLHVSVLDLLKSD